MRSVLVGLVIVILAGCSATPEPVLNNTPKADLKANFGPNVDKEYATKILAALDRFSAVSEEAQRLDEDTIKAYQKNVRPTKSMLDKLSKAVTDEMDIVKSMKDLNPPSKFEGFHKQVVKSSEKKVDNMAGLLLAMESNDKAEIRRVLDSIVKDGKQSKQEMDAILQGKTAEAYLGVDK